MTADMAPKVQLITYVDRLAEDIRGLIRLLLDEKLGDLFGGVHLLPFFDPIDGADAGFDPVDHLRVDPRLGDWGDVHELSRHVSIMADLICNHVSRESEQFKSVSVDGKQSAYWDFFLKASDVFPGGREDEEGGRIYRPRPGLPLTEISLDCGETHDFWTTFTADQLDINVETAQGKQYLESIVDRFAQAGIREIRLDAAGYAIKRRGTSCFMLPETFEFIASLARYADSRGIETLVEIHSHFETQIDIASHVSCVYDFCLPPLVLHAFYQHDANPLKRWLEIAPRNCVTVLDTHDGIGIVDVASDGDKPGLLNDDQIDALVEGVHDRTEGASRSASGYAASNLDVYQVNSTFYDALGRADDAWLLARAIQLFAPGTPQIYYVGLLAGENDVELLQKTGVGRDINRHYFTSEEIDSALQKTVVQSLLELIRLRNESPAFDGSFAVAETDQSSLSLHWAANGAAIALEVDLAARAGRIVEDRNGDLCAYEIGTELRKTQ